MSFSNKIKEEIKNHKGKLPLWFLNNGSISNPDKGYHLEFAFTDAEEAKELYELLMSHSLNAKEIKRRNNYVVYIKESEHIADFLSIVGAHNALMEYHNIRILKDISGNINRKVNLEAANLEKTINAALSLQDDIQFLLNYPTNVLSPELKVLAVMRLEHTDATLKELGEKFEPAISKSCVNHRLRKIKKIADGLR